MVASAVSESRGPDRTERAGVYLVYRDTSQGTGKSDVDNRVSGLNAKQAVSGLLERLAPSGYHKRNNKLLSGFRQ